MRAVLVAMLLSGCHDLPDLGTCGNGIIEATNGEACDGDIGGNDTCNDRCELSCQTAPVTDAYVKVGTDATSGALYCPDERMTCALDRVCRAGGGQFSTPGDLQDFNVRFTAVGDFDGDQIDDLIGSTATSVVVRFGTDRGGALLASYSQPAPAGQAPPAFFDRDPLTAPSGVSQLAMAIPNDGIGLLTSNTESFLADLDTTFNLTNFATRVPLIVEEPPRAGGNVPDLGDTPYEVARAGTAGLVVKRLDTIDGPGLSQPPPVCGSGVTTLVDIAVSVDRRAFVVVAKTGINAFEVCRYSHSGTPATWAFATTPLMGQLPDHALLANIAGDACPELVLTARNGTTTVVSYLPAAGPGCGFTNARTPLTPSLSGEFSVLAAGDVRPGSGADELVTSSGVFGVTGTALALVIGPTVADRPWQAAAVVDVDRDGILDVVAGRSDQDDVDVVRGGAVPNAYRADTDSEVISVIPGDFDGDGIGDAALVERTGANKQRLSVVYGATAGAIGPAIAMVPFGNSVLRLASVRFAEWVPSPRIHDGVEDLIVIKAEATGATAAAGVMFGEASRRLTMPRFPIDAKQIASVHGVLVAGNLAGSDLANGGTLQVGVISNGDASIVGRSLLLNNVATAAWSRVDITGVAVPIDLVKPPALLRGKTAPWLAFGTKDSAMKEGVAATDVGGHGCAAPASTPAVLRVRGGDIVGDDGVDELVIASPTMQGVQVHVYPITASGAGCAIGAEPALGLGGCADVARVGHQLVAVCLAEAGTDGVMPRWGLYRVSETGARDATPFAAVDGTGVQLTTGDFDGDGVQDLAVAVARGGVLGVQLVHQCPAHDERGCQ